MPHIHVHMHHRDKRHGDCGGVGERPWPHGYAGWDGKDQGATRPPHAEAPHGKAWQPEWRSFPQGQPGWEDQENARELSGLERFQWNALSPTKRQEWIEKYNKMKGRDAHRKATGKGRKTRR